MSTPTPSAPAAPANGPAAPTPAAPSNGPAAPTPAAPQAPAAPSAPAAPAAPAAPQAPATAAPAAPPAPAQGEPQDVASLPEWAQREIRDARAEAARYRTRAQEPAAPAPTAPADAPEGDVSRLPQWAQRAITDAQGATRQLALRDAVMATADAAGANLRAVIDSNTAMTALANVDPADHAAVTAALQAAVQANPHLAAQSGPPRGGVDFSGHGAGEVTPAQFAAMSYAERVALHQSDPDTYRRLAGA